MFPIMYRPLTTCTPKIELELELLFGCYAASKMDKALSAKQAKNSLPKRPLQFEIDTSLFKFKCVLDPTACGLCAQFSHMHM